MNPPNDFQSKNRRRFAADPFCYAALAWDRWTSTVAEAGMPLSAIKDHLGHPTIAMAERYARRRLLKEGAAMLGELVGPHLEQARIAD